MAGVIITAGMQPRIPVGGLTISEGRAESRATIEVRLDTWNHWLLIAHEMTQLAEVAHSEVQRCFGDGAHSAGVTAMEEEFRSAMVSIAAQAFAFDALYSAVRVRLRKPATAGKAGTARYKWITETLRRGFRVGPKSTASLRGFLRLLFRFRDWAVHPPNDFRQPIYRPDVDAGVEWRFAVYNAENARNALTKTVSAIDQLFILTRDTEKEVRDWALGARELLDAAVSSRTSS